MCSLHSKHGCCGASAAHLAVDSLGLGDLAQQLLNLDAHAGDALAVRADAVREHRVDRVRHAAARRARTQLLLFGRLCRRGLGEGGNGGGSDIGVGGDVIGPYGLRRRRRRRRDPLHRARLRGSGGHSHRHRGWGRPHVDDGAGRDSWVDDHHLGAIGRDREELPAVGNPQGHLHRHDRHGGSRRAPASVQPKARRD